MPSRVFGLSGSGLDVDQLVKEAMKGQRARYDTLFQRKTQLEWRKNSYNDMYKAINEFRNNVFNYQLESTLSPKTVSTNDNDIVSVTAGAGAASINHRLVVNNMAEGVTLVSSASLGSGSDKTSLATQFGLLPGQTFTVKVTNGSVSKEISVNTDKSIYEFIGDVNKAGVNIKANYDTTVDRLFLNSTNTGSNVTIDFSGSSDAGLNFIKNNLKIAPTAAPVSSVTGTAGIGLDPLNAPLSNQFADLTAPFDFTIKDVDHNTSKVIHVDPSTDSLQSLMNKVNSDNTEPRVYLAYDPSLGKMMFGTRNGNNTHFALSSSDGSSFVTNDLKLPTDIPDATTATSSTADIGLDVSKCLNDTLAHQLGVTGSMNLNINGQAVTINATDTVNGLMSKINGMGADATASYDAATGKFSIRSTSGTGTLDFSQSDSAALSFLTGKLKLPLQNRGEDAAVTIDGVPFTESSNVFTVAGLTYTLKGENPLTPITVSVRDDIDKTVENVKKFIESYNKMLDSVNKAVDEPVYRDYLPLTNEQKADMKDAEITLWEQKAKSGLLHNDAALQSLANEMRSDLSTPIAGIPGKYISAASIGITTGDYTEKGKLYLDDQGEKKLRDALQVDPDIVYKLFGTASDNLSEKGMAVKLYDSLKAASDKIVTTAGTTATATYDTKSTLGKEIRDYDSRMYDMNKRLKDMEDSYYKKFSALETAIYKMNSQNSWMSQQLGSK